MVSYCTREDVMSATDIKATANASTSIDSAKEAGARAVEGLLHRRFYPLLTTRYFDYPNDQNADTGRLWLDDNELISAITILSAGVEIPVGNYFLEPVNYGPPYDRLELNRATTSSFSSGNTYQQSIGIYGLYGYDLNEVSGGTCVEALDASETQIDVSGSPHIGVGSLLRIDTERMIVTERAWLSTSQTNLSALTASAADVSVSVTDGSVFAAGEILLLDSERVLVVDVAGNTLTVKRAVQGSVLATHTSATIYAARTLTVERGALGTTASTHLINATIYVHAFPGLVRELNTAYAVNNLQQRSSGYARVSGSRSSTTANIGRGIKDIEADAYARYGRQARMRAV